MLLLRTPREQRRGVSLPVEEPLEERVRNCEYQIGALAQALERVTITAAPQVSVNGVLEELRESRARRKAHLRAETPERTNGTPPRSEAVNVTAATPQVAKK